MLVLILAISEATYSYVAYEDKAALNALIEASTYAFEANVDAEAFRLAMSERIPGIYPVLSFTDAQSPSMSET